MLETLKYLCVRTTLRFLNYSVYAKKLVHSPPRIVLLDTTLPRLDNATLDPLLFGKNTYDMVNPNLVE